LLDRVTLLSKGHSCVYKFIIRPFRLFGSTDKVITLERS
jgi:hypothetical protein